MRKMTTKVTAWAMMSAMVLGLSACGGGGGTGTTAADTAAAQTEKAETGTKEAAKEEETQASDSGKTKVSFWHSMSGVNGETLQSIVNEYNASQDKVEIVMEFQGDYKEAIAKVQTAIASGNGPDILQTGSNEVAVLAREEGILENLIPYMEGTSDMDISDFYPAFISAMGMDPETTDNLAAFPMGCSTPVMFCNKDVLDKAGAAVPETWDELAEVTKKLIADGTIEYGFAMPCDSWYFWMMVPQNGTKIFSEDGLSLACVDDGSGIEIIENLQKMCQDKVMYFGPVTDSSSTCRGMFLDGRCAFYVDSCANLNAVDSNAGFNYSLEFIPRFKVNSVPSGGNTLTMLASAKNKDAAWDFLHWMYTENSGVATFSATTGYIPCSKTISEMPIIKEKISSNPNYGVAIDQLQYGNNDYMIMQPGSGNINNNITAMMQACFFDNEDVAEQMGILKEEAEDVLADLQ